jgi:hypothetical protein
MLLTWLLTLSDEWIDFYPHQCLQCLIISFWLCFFSPYICWDPKKLLRKMCWTQFIWINLKSWLWQEKKDSGLRVLEYLHAVICGSLLVKWKSLREEAWGRQYMWLTVYSSFQMRVFREEWKVNIKFAAVDLFRDWHFVKSFFCAKFVLCWGFNACLAPWPTGFSFLFLGKFKVTW